MQALLIRHGRTPGNDERRYIGRTDEPLSGPGREEAEKVRKDFTRSLASAHYSQKTVWVSPLIRARETASILFPDARQIVLPGLRETDFGTFEGKTADEMSDDPAYRAWVDGMCLGTCPNGESRADVTARAAEAFSSVIRAALKDKSAADAPRVEGPFVFVTHGGVIMSILEALALPHMDYYDYYTPNLGGWTAECAEEDGQIVLRDLQRISHTSLQ